MHFIAYPDDVSRCLQREAQATVIQQVLPHFFSSLFIIFICFLFIYYLRSFFFFSLFVFFFLSFLISFWFSISSLC